MAQGVREFEDDLRDEMFRQDMMEQIRREQMMIDAMRQLERETRPTQRVDRPSGPSLRDLEQMRERDIQMAEYLATNPDPITGLVREVINNPAIKMTKPQKDAVNDRKKVMNRNGRIVKAQSGRSAIRSSGQFRNTGIPLPPVKRTRKKTKMDKTMSTCLKMANKRMRKKNGQLRKGKTMSDVMRLAHRLCKKS